MQVLLKHNILMSTREPLTLITFQRLGAGGKVDVQVTHILTGKLTLTVNIRYDNGTTDQPRLYDDGTITYQQPANPEMERLVRAAFDWLHNLWSPREHTRS